MNVSLLFIKYSKILLLREALLFYIFFPPHELIQKVIIMILPLASKIS